MRAPSKSSYPEKVFVGAHKQPYMIKFVAGKKWYGKCSAKKQIIWLNLDQSASQMFMTFIHELLHAIEFELDVDIKHKAVYAFESGLYSFLTNNVKEFKFK